MMINKLYCLHLWELITPNQNTPEENNQSLIVTHFGKY